MEHQNFVKSILEQMHATPEQKLVNISSHLWRKENISAFAVPFQRRTKKWKAFWDYVLPSSLAFSSSLLISLLAWVFISRFFFFLCVSPLNIVLSLLFLVETGKLLNLLPVCGNRDPYSIPCPPLQWRVTMIINLTPGLPIKILVCTQMCYTEGNTSIFMK